MLVIPYRYHITVPQTFKTLQLFITNRCNKRCKGCFYQSELGREEMSFHEYADHVKQYDRFNRVTILGGEPTMHPDLPRMIRHNQGRGKLTTIYTNGYALDRLDGMDLTDVSIRIGVLGLNKSEKPLAEIRPPRYPVGVVYMLRQDNIDDLIPTFLHAVHNFNLKYFYISSIRDIETTGSFWKDTEDTIPNEQYAVLVQAILDTYNGDIPIHVSRRGVIDAPVRSGEDTCRFFNLFTSREPCMCPFDISIGKVDPSFTENRKCNKHSECLLQKLILTPIKP